VHAALLHLSKTHPLEGKNMTRYFGMMSDDLHAQRAYEETIRQREIRNTQRLKQKAQSPATKPAQPAQPQARYSSELAQGYNLGLQIGAQLLAAQQQAQQAQPPQQPKPQQKPAPVRSTILPYQVSISSASMAIFNWHNGGSYLCIACARLSLVHN